jgi:thiosulfate dehydrogenase
MNWNRVSGLKRKRKRGKKYGRTIFAFAPVAILLLLFPYISLSGDLSHLFGSHLRQISQGGRLYDKWWAQLHMDAPKTTHFSYPEMGKKKDASTWRCKECHGWDYKGKRGAYREGSHFSGISGIRNMANGSAQDVVATLKDETHRYGSLMPAQALQALATFVVAGQVDMDEYIERGTKKVRGDPVKGGRIYLTICAECHGLEGKAINFGNAQKPKYVGSLASQNPWETFHKIRVGQPGKKMPPMLVLPLHLQADVLAYSQTLLDK